jgi:predicted acylesterase/phospholipase RssA
VVTAQETLSESALLKYLRASASDPGFFPPVTEGKMTLVDGSSMMSVDLTATIERCREIVDRDEDIVLDIIMVQEGMQNVHA